MRWSSLTLAASSFWISSLESLIFTMDLFLWLTRYGDSSEESSANPMLPEHSFTLGAVRLCCEYSMSSNNVEGPWSPSQMPLFPSSAGHIHCKCLSPRPPPGDCWQEQDATRLPPAPCTCAGSVVAEFSRRGEGGGLVCIGGLKQALPPGPSPA